MSLVIQPRSSHRLNAYNKAALTFEGLHKVYAYTDSHQHTDNKCALLSRILNEAIKDYEQGGDKHFLVLDCGDTMKGLFPPDLEIQAYTDFMEQANRLCPNKIDVVVNVGNNDSKICPDDFSRAAKAFKKAGIQVISANSVDKDGCQFLPEIQPYTVIKKNDDNIMVIGFNSEDRAVFVCKDPEYKKKKILDQLKVKIDKEKPSSIIVLNHDSLSESEELVRYAKQIGIPVNFMIGGHSHHFSKDDSLKIYYPHRFCESMFDFDMDINRGKVAVTRNTIITSKGIKINRIIPEQLAKAKAEMDKPIAKSVINLEKNNAGPSSFGTFLADAMRESSNSDIGFFSQGFNTEPLPYRQGEMIRERDLKEAMSAGREIVKVTLDPTELKEVFQHALKEKYKSGDNKRGLQFSQNIKIEGHEQDRLYTVDQIYINGEALFNGDGSVKLNENGQAPKFTCAIDGYIAEGKSGYTILKAVPQEKTSVNMKEALLARLQLAELRPNFVENPYSYPKAQVITL